MANTYELIQSFTATGSTSQIDFSSIPQTYTDLNLLASVRSSTNPEIYISINNSVGSGYRTQNFNGSGPSSVSWSQYQTAKAYIGEPAYNTQTADTFGSFSVYLPKYTSSSKKTLQTESGQATQATSPLYWYINGSLFNSTNAISSLQVYISAGNISAGSTFYLYGIKNS